MSVEMKTIISNSNKFKLFSRKKSLKGINRPQRKVKEKNIMKSMKVNTTQKTMTRTPTVIKILNELKIKITCQKLKVILQKLTERSEKTLMTSACR